MTKRVLPILAIVAGPLVALPLLQGAERVTSDLVPPPKRQITVELAEKLARRPPPAPLPADLPSPFNPADFDKPDPAEAPAAAVKPGATPAAPAAGGSAPTVAAQPASPATDRQTLEALAAQITPSGSLVLRGAPQLIVQNKRFEVGTRFIATYNNQDYELELVAINPTTFTLRYRGEEVTRSIRPVR